MDNAKISGHHWKIMFISGMGFFTDAYDLFIIGVVMTLLKDIWHFGKLEESLVEIDSPARRSIGCAALWPGGRHAWSQADLRSRGAGAGGRRDCLRLCPEYPVAHRVALHPGHRHRRRLPGQRDHHERILWKKPPWHDGDARLCHASRGSDRWAVICRRAAVHASLARHHLAHSRRLRSRSGAG